MNKEVELNTLNSEIKNLEESTWIEQTKLFVTEEELNTTKAKVELSVVKEKDLVTNKPLYPNESARKNATNLQLYGNEGTKVLLKSVITMRDTIELNKIKLNFLLRKFSIIKDF